MNLAIRKAQSLVNHPGFEATTGGVLLAADTVVISPAGVLLGQPANRAHARRILQSLIGYTHRVATGVAIMNLDAPQDGIKSFSDSADVSIGWIDVSRIDAYLDSVAWRGKAGGYNLYEIQDHWPVTVEGDATTVVGLPMKKLSRYYATIVQR